MTQENRPVGDAAGNGGGQGQGYGGDAGAPGGTPPPPPPPGFAPAPPPATPAPGYGVLPQGPWPAQNPPPVPPGSGPLPWGPPVPGGPGARRSGGKAVGIVLACVLALLLVGGGIAFVVFSSGADSANSGTEAKAPGSALDVTWHSDALPRSTALPGVGTAWPGRWIHNGVLVYGDENGVRGYDMETGHQKWRVKPPKGAGEPCAMSAEPSVNGVGAVVFDAGGDECSYLAAVDLDSGRVTWAKKLLSKYGENGPQVEVGDKYLSVALNNVEGMKTYDVRTGAAADPFAAGGIDCAYHFVFSADHVVAKPGCHDQLVVLDTQYGGKPAVVPHQKGRPVKILSDDPLRVVVTTTDAEDSPQKLLVFSDDGASHRTVDLQGPAAKMVLDDAGDHLVGKNLYFCKLHNGYNALIDLDEGTAVWTANRPTSYAGYDSARGRVLVVSSDRHKVWPRVDALDPDTGKLTFAGSLVMPDGSYVSVPGSLYAYDTHRLVTIGTRSSDGERAIEAFRVDLPTS